MRQSNTKPAPAQADAFADPGRDAPTGDTIAAPSTEAALPEPVREQISTNQALIQQAEAQAVTDPATYTSAAELLQTMQGAYRRLESERLGITRPMDAAKQRVMDLFRPRLFALEAAGKILRGKLAAYDAVQERIAAEARRKAEEEAARQRREQEAKERAEREKAEAQRREAERQRKEAEAAERRRVEQEQAAERARQQEEEARRRGEAEAAERARLERERAEQEAEAERQRQAEAARAAANADRNADRAENRAEAAAEASTSIVAPVVTTEQPKVDGLARRKVWKYRIKDPAKIARAFTVPDETKIAATLKAMGADAVDIMGGPDAIEAWQENAIAARGR